MSTPTFGIQFATINVSLLLGFGGIVHAEQTCWEGNWKHSSRGEFGTFSSGKGSGLVMMPSRGELTEVYQDARWLSFHYTWDDQFGHQNADGSPKVSVAAYSDAYGYHLTID